MKHIYVIARETPIGLVEDSTEAKTVTEVVFHLGSSTVPGGLLGKKCDELNLEAFNNKTDKELDENYEDPFFVLSLKVIE